MNAILVPSGDHAGWRSAAKVLVTRCTPLPSAFMNQMSKLESGTRALLKAIFVPSADHCRFEVPAGRVGR